MEDVVIKVARLLSAAGGRALLVGGCVRDQLLGFEPKDFDVEVVNVREATQEDLDALDSGCGCGCGCDGDCSDGNCDCDGCC